MIYIGANVHKSYFEIAIVDDEGNLKSRKRVRNIPESLDKMVQSLGTGVMVAMESCSYIYLLYNRLEEAGAEVKVAHPLRVKLIAESRIQSDKIDTLILAQLHRLDYLPTGYIPPREIHHCRDLLQVIYEFLRQFWDTSNEYIIR